MRSTIWTLYFETATHIKKERTLLPIKARTVVNCLGGTLLTLITTNFANFPIRVQASFFLSRMEGTNVGRVPPRPSPASPYRLSRRVLFAVLTLDSAVRRVWQRWAVVARASPATLPKRIR